MLKLKQRPSLNRAILGTMQTLNSYFGVHGVEIKPSRPGNSDFIYIGFTVDAFGAFDWSLKLDATEQPQITLKKFLFLPNCF